MGKTSYLWCLVFTLVLTTTVAQEEEPYDYDDRAPPCNPPFVEVSGHCLFFYHHVADDWDTAQVECQLFGGNLTKIESGDMMEGIAKYIRDNPMDVDGFWVGAKEKTGAWMWIDDTYVKMGTPFWGYEGKYPPKQEPDGGSHGPFCAVMVKKYFYYLHDYQCKEKFSPLCEA